ncbi:hypothetical protein AMATHDRAFT_9579 [Amanita thiersii Skay4041]|uniref:Uncharacterized protein n=1 Tax=Amanita thiersii Skay4041 TaxID=703135 RepID=A0A2A9N8D5_9AGAR|nr:hypothetical protein AMATHDRAFT_9579 [Amanita thiersii Skay4041]
MGESLDVGTWTVLMPGERKIDLLLPACDTAQMFLLDETRKGSGSTFSARATLKEICWLLYSLREEYPSDAFTPQEIIQTVLAYRRDRPIYMSFSPVGIKKATNYFMTSPHVLQAGMPVQYIHAKREKPSSPYPYAPMGMDRD